MGLGLGGLEYYVYISFYSLSLSFSRGFGFVLFKQQDSVQKVMKERQEQILDGKKVCLVMLTSWAH